MARFLIPVGERIAVTCDPTTWKDVSRIGRVLRHSGTGRRVVVTDSWEVHRYGPARLSGVLVVNPADDE